MTLYVLGFYFLVNKVLEIDSDDETRGILVKSVYIKWVIWSKWECAGYGSSNSVEEAVLWLWKVWKEPANTANTALYCEH